MRRRFNWVAVLILLVTTAGLATGGFFLHRYQVRTNARALLDQADLTRKAREELRQGGGAEGEADKETKLLDKEIDYLRRYLGFVPDDNPVLERYGLLLADDQIAGTPLARFRAMTVLEQVVAHDPDRAEVRRKVIDLAMSIGRFTDAARHLAALIPDTKDAKAPRDPVLVGLLGVCSQETGKLSQARDQYEEAVRQPGAAVETYARLAELLRREGSALLRGEETTADLATLA